MDKTVLSKDGESSGGDVSRLIQSFNKKPPLGISSGSTLPSRKNLGIISNPLLADRYQSIGALDSSPYHSLDKYVTLRSSSSSRLSREDKSSEMKITQVARSSSVRIGSYLEPHSGPYRDGSRTMGRRQATASNSLIQRRSRPPPVRPPTEPPPPPPINKKPPPPPPPLDQQKKPRNPSAKIRKCRAVYSCKADNDDELTFEEGDIIVIMKQITEDVLWMEGFLFNNPTKRGLFPESFVNIID